LHPDMIYAGFSNSGNPCILLALMNMAARK
jgi:hypothetical protein